MSELGRIIEALLFLANDPVGAEELAEVTGCSVSEVAGALEELAAAWAPGLRGLLLREVAGATRSPATRSPSPRRGRC